MSSLFDNAIRILAKASKTDLNVNQISEIQQLVSSEAWVLITHDETLSTCGQFWKWEFGSLILSSLLKDIKESFRVPKGSAWLPQVPKFKLSFSTHAIAQ